MMKSLGRLRVFFLITLSLALSGCLGNRYQAPIGSFRDRTQNTVGVLSDFYSSRNSYEIDVYLQAVAADASLPVQTKDAEGHPTPLGKPVFSPASIQARLDALNLVGAYAGKLSDLANPDSQTSFGSAATLLGENLSSLDKTFQTLQGRSDPTASKFIQPVSNLVGAIGQMYLDRKRDQLITQAIKDGAPQVDIILSQVRDDMNKIFSPEIVTGSSEKLALLIAAYNADRARLTYEQRVARLAGIKAAADEAAASVGSGPASLVTSMMEAHHALVQVAQSPRNGKPANFAAFNAALDQWTTQIQNVAAQIHTLVH